jgi:hypothetical protein
VICGSPDLDPDPDPEKLSIFTPAMKSKKIGIFGSPEWSREIVLSPLRGRLHVYESVYGLLYDSMHDLLPKGFGFEFFIIHPLPPCVNTFKKKSIPNSIAIHLWHQIVHRIVCRFVREFLRVDAPKHFLIFYISP